MLFFLFHYLPFKIFWPPNQIIYDSLSPNALQHLSWSQNKVTKKCLRHRQRRFPFFAAAHTSLSCLRAIDAEMLCLWRFRLDGNKSLLHYLYHKHRWAWPYVPLALMEGTLKTFFRLRTKQGEKLMHICLVSGDFTYVAVPLHYAINHTYVCSGSTLKLSFHFKKGNYLLPVSGKYSWPSS